VSFFLLSYWLTGEGSKSLFILIPGAIFAGVLALGLNNWIVKSPQVREDSGLGVMLAVFFWTGIFLLRWTQKASRPIPGRSGLQDYLFGMAAAMTKSDLWMISIVGLISFTVIGLLWKELKAYTIDPVLSQTLGFRRSLLDTVVIFLLVNGIVIGIQSIGVVLMVAMLIAPAAAARQWCRSLEALVIVAAIFGATSGAIGSTISALVSKMPTGPIIILVSIAIFACSVLFAPQRGVVSRTISSWKNAKMRMDTSRMDKEKA